MKNQSMNLQEMNEVITNSYDTSVPTVRYSLFFVKQQLSENSFQVFSTVS